MSSGSGRDFDYIVIGSGFGGSVSALRLAEKGFRVADRSVVPANLGVNPSLTITALSEYIMSQVPARQVAERTE